MKKPARSLDNLPIVGTTGNSTRGGSSSLPEARFIVRLEHEVEELRQQLALESEMAAGHEQRWTKAQQELELSREHYADLHDTALVGYVLLDSHGFIHEANMTVARLLGIPHDQLPNTLFSQFVVREERSKLLEHLRQCRHATGATSVLTELKINGVQGRQFDIALTTLTQSPPPTLREKVRFRTAVVDITSRKQVEAALRSSEEQYRLLFELNPNPMWIFEDRTLRFLALNEAAVRLYGWSRAEFLRLTVKDILPPEEAPKLREKLGQPGSVPFAAEWRHCRRDGTVLDVEMTTSDLRFQGRAARLSMIKDVSQRKRQQRQLAEQARLLDLSNDAILVRDAGDRITYWNHGAEKLYGWTSAEALGRCSHELLSTRFPEPLAVINRKLRRDNRWEGELIHTCRDGRRVIVASRWALDRDTEGRRALVLETNNDITEQKQAEEQLKELNTTLDRRVATRTAELTRLNELLRASEGALADFFDEAPIGLLWVSPDGRILRANQAQAAMFGCSQQELDGRKLPEYGAGRETVSAILSELARRRSVRDRLLRFHRRNGSILHTFIDANGLWEKGKLVYSRWFVRDVSRRVELQKEILAIGERVQQQLGQDLHDDLCQQLTSIEYLGRALERQLDAKSKADAGRAREIALLTRRAMTYTRKLSHTMLPMELAADGLPGALKNLCARMESLFRINCQFRSDSNVLVDDSAAQICLYRIAQEAIHNAIKHGKARRVQIDLFGEAGNVVLRVRDNGLGLPRHPSKSRGFGLRIMEYRAGAQGGSLVVQKRKGGGTTLVCSLPVTCSRPAAK